MQSSCEDIGFLHVCDIGRIGCYALDVGVFVNFEQINAMHPAKIAISFITVIVIIIYASFGLLRNRLISMNADGAAICKQIPSCVAMADSLASNPELLERAQSYNRSKKE